MIRPVGCRQSANFLGNLVNKNFLIFAHFCRFYENPYKNLVNLAVDNLIRDASGKPGTHGTDLCRTPEGIL